MATIAPLPATYMLNAGYSWHLFFYVVLAFSVALFVLAFLTVEETSYHRVLTPQSATLSEGKPSSDQLERAGGNFGDDTDSLPLRKSFVETLSVTGRTDHSVRFFATMARSFTYFLVPQVIWVITTFGITIGLGAFVISFTFPLKIVVPPYNWDIVRSARMPRLSPC
jgi:Flp pilus assembly protein TadB